MDKSVTQEDMMGCGIACVAFVLGKSYAFTKKLFDKPDKSALRGFLCSELVKGLKKGGRRYAYAKVGPKNKSLLNKSGTIVFLKRDKKFPSGHYIVRGENGWMNPWINFPCVIPAKSGFEKKIPGESQWIIYEID